MQTDTGGDGTAVGGNAGWIVAMDVGGSGSRLSAELMGARHPGTGDSISFTLEGDPVKIGPEGSNAAQVVRGLCETFLYWVKNAEYHFESPPVVHAAAVGATGLTSVVPSTAEIHDVMGSMLRTNRTAVAGDALTAHMGALRGRPGAVLSVGTGAVAFSFDQNGRWRRADGWGHLLGDLGAGVWVGSEALRAATAAHDGRPRGGSQRLLNVAVQKLGPVPSWPAQLYMSNDRAAKLASFAPAVMAAAEDGDPIANTILTEAGRHLAATLATALSPEIPQLASITGRLAHRPSPLTESLYENLMLERPGVRLVPSDGSPLDGAKVLARKLANDASSVVGYRPWLTVRVDGRHTTTEHSDAGADMFSSMATSQFSATELPDVLPNTPGMT
ncbi:N-acetylglucosamine kinase [Myceligenerans crystallogenes]|uniref:BadF/BadG/BcrA/BcrD ATPase family protein n=1 Tax=Myceligenerans crystallogenes TaxID=316335 RepID=A0ABN2NMH1_9MICO